MKYLRQFNTFFNKALHDNLLNPSHISIYMALFQCWSCNNFQNPVSITREEVMKLSKISSRATYHRCLKYLITMGYIKYVPSFNPYKASQIFIISLN